MASIFASMEAFIHRLNGWIRWISMGTLFIMMFFVTAGVVSRYLLQRPIKGDMELQELGMVLIVFIAFPYCQSQKGNVYVELLIDRLKGRSKAILSSLAYFLGMIIVALLIWQTSMKAIHGLAAMRTDVTLTLYIPIAPFLVIADIGLILLGLEWLIDLIHFLNRAVGIKESQKANLLEPETGRSN